MLFGSQRQLSPVFPVQLLKNTHLQAADAQGDTLEGLSVILHNTTAAQSQSVCRVQHSLSQYVECRTGLALCRVQDRALLACGHTRHQISRHQTHMRHIPCLTPTTWPTADAMLMCARLTYLLHAASPVSRPKLASSLQVRALASNQRRRSSYAVDMGHQVV
jgi:hypothetical protein